MGTNYRRGRLVFDAVDSVDAGVESDVAIVKNAPRAGVLVQNTGANIVDVFVEVKAASQREGGINSQDEITADAGWHRYHVLDQDGAPTALVLSVDTNDTMAIDLSVFAFDAIRLVALPSSAGDQGTVTATVTWGS